MDNLMSTFELRRCSEDNQDNSSDSAPEMEFSSALTPLPQKFLARQVSKAGTNRHSELSRYTSSKHDMHRNTGASLSLDETARWKCTTEERQQSAYSVASLLVAYRMQRDK